MKDNIKNELAYFYTVIKNMDAKDAIKQSQINAHETSLEKLLYDQFSIAENMDKHLEERSPLGWIESIENSDLYKAVKALSVDEQILLSYLFEKGMTQRELAKIYKIRQQSMCEKIDRIIAKLKQKL